MGRMTTSALSFSLAVALCTAALPAAAHEAGDWLIRAGVTQVKPKSSNGTAAGLNLDVDSAVRPSLSAAYMVNRNLGVELLAATPFRHDIAGSG
ncbi:MAG: OmpW family outer membrane protein, partial [Pigmentiphaga sp.]